MAGLPDIKSTGQDGLDTPDQAQKDGAEDPGDARDDLGLGRSDVATRQDVRVTFLAPEGDDQTGTQVVMLPDGAVARLPIGTFRADDPIETVEELLAAAAVGICAGSEILTPRGTRPIEDLVAGDPVTIADGITQEIRWIGRRRVKAQGSLAPIKFRSGAMGQHDALTVMPQQRMLIQDWRADLLFGEPEVLVPARYLVDGEAVTKMDGGEIEAFLLLFDRHCTVRANRCPTESFLPSEQTLMTMDDTDRAQVLKLYPYLRSDPLNGYGRDVRPTLRRWEVKYLMR
ncbi:MAG: Hint domain-containing protein [Pseudomonadota bacterium]